MIRTALLLVVAGSVVACDTSPRGPLADLAVEWSGGSANVRCKDTGPRGENIGPIPGTEYCEWVRPDAPGAAPVIGMRYQRRLASLTWSPTARDSAGTARDVALLAASMQKRGLVGFPCNNAARVAAGVQGVRWANRSIAVQLSRLAFPSGEERIVVFAIDAPDATPPEFCAKLR